MILRQTKPLLKRLRDMVTRLKNAANVESSLPAGLSSSSADLVKSLQTLHLCQSSFPRGQSSRPSLFVNYDAILTTLNTIDTMYSSTAIPPLLLQKTTSKAKVVM